MKYTLTLLAAGLSMAACSSKPTYPPYDGGPGAGGTGGGTTSSTGGTGGGATTTSSTTGGTGGTTTSTTSTTTTTTSTGSCDPLGAACVTLATCCAGAACVGGACCAPMGAACTATGECCGNAVCTAGKCAVAQCQPDGAACAADVECCGVVCCNHACQSTPCTGCPSDAPTCAEVASGAAPIGNLCGPPIQYFNALWDCLCTGACAAKCGANYCQGDPASAACTGCTVDSATGCGAAHAACLLH